MKRKIRLTESDLHRIVKESVNRILRENNQSTLINDLREMVYAMLNRCYQYPHGGATVLKSDVDETFQMAKQLYSSMKTRETYEIMKDIEEISNTGSIGSGKLVKINDMLGSI